MSYRYEEQKERLFTDEGNRLFTAFRDRALALLRESGAVRMEELLKMRLSTGSAPDWDKVACADRMVEIGDLREIEQRDIVGQQRVFVARRS